MGYSKQTMIDGLKQSIEITEQEIKEYSKPCDKRLAQGRTAHREYLKKTSEKNESATGGVGRMIISDKEWLKFEKDGQKFALEILGESFQDDDEEVE